MDETQDLEADNARYKAAYFRMYHNCCILERERKDYKTRMQIWYGKYHVLRLENNALRKQARQLREAKQRIAQLEAERLPVTERVGYRFEEGEEV